jgi:LacI family transcriptional regulator
MKKITIKDIAIEARVSISTVSFVLNNKGEKMGISEGRIKKIQEVAKNLNYKPNMIARSLRTGKTKSLGLIVEDISNQFFSDLARVIEEQARKVGYRVFYCSTGNDDDRSEELIHSLLQANVDGFIITPTVKLEKTIDYLLKIKKPVVLIDRCFPDQNVSHVVLDNYECSKEATTYFINKGFKNIALITTSSQMIQMYLRKQGYLDVMLSAGVYDESLILDLEYHTSEEFKIDAIYSFFKENKRIEAVLFLTNYLGLSGLQAFRKLNITIPKELSIISFDDHYSFKLHTPSIAVIEQPIGNIAEKAVELLMDQINNEDAYVVEKIVQKGKLLIRESVL